MAERELKHWVIDYIEERLKSRGELVDGRIEWLKSHVEDSFNELSDYSNKLADCINKNFGQQGERLKALEAELKSALLLHHEMKGKLDAMLAYSERPHQRRGKIKQGVGLGWMRNGDCGVGVLRGLEAMATITILTRRLS